jgi:hypothetical protein
MFVQKSLFTWKICDLNSDKILESHSVGTGTVIVFASSRSVLKNFYGKY